MIQAALTLAFLLALNAALAYLIVWLRRGIRELRVAIYETACRIEDAGHPRDWKTYDRGVRKLAQADGRYKP